VSFRFSPELARLSGNPDVQRFVELFKEEWMTPKIDLYRRQAAISSYMESKMHAYVDVDAMLRLIMDGSYGRGER